MKKNLQYLIDSLLTILYFCTIPFPALAQEKYTLEYKFKLNDQLQYKTEKLDTMSSSMPDGQEITRKITSFSLKTLTITNTPPDNPFAASITIDSTWSDSESDNDFEERDNRPGGRRARISLREENQNFTFNKYGKSTTDESIVSPLIIPLPEKPISINDQWNFTITTDRKGRFQAEITITGKCLLYDVQQTKGNNIAVIIVDSKTTGQGKFQIKTQDREISGTNRSSGTGNFLVYFDIDNGRINEIISEEKSESATEGSAFSSNMSRTSKSTTKLINK